MSIMGRIEICFSRTILEEDESMYSTFGVNICDAQFEGKF